MTFLGVVPLALTDRRALLDDDDDDDEDGLLLGLAVLAVYLVAQLLVLSFSRAGEPRQTGGPVSTPPMVTRWRRRW